VAERGALEKPGEARLRGLRRQVASPSRPGFHRGSGDPWAALMVRAARNSRSESRLRYLMLSTETPSMRPRATSERSARRHTARAESLPTRVPSPRPVVPSSPVLVTILVRRFAICGAIVADPLPGPLPRERENFAAIIPRSHGFPSYVKTSFLDFEQPIAELEQKIEELRFVQDDSAVDISQEIERLSKKSRELTKDIYAKLTAWQ